MRRLTLIGFGAIGRSVYQRLQGHARLQIDAVVVPPRSVAATQAAVASGSRVCTEVPEDAYLLLECAGHAALVAHVLGQPKVTAVQVVMMLSTQAFALAFGRARRDAGIPTNRLPQEFFAFLKETGGYPGRPWGEAASAWTKVTEQWSAAACEKALVLLLEADIALKESTVSNAEQILMSLVLSLCATRRRKAA